MPELPEVENVRRGLERALVGKTITDVRVVVPKLLKAPSASPEEFAAGLIGRRFEKVRRRGKHLIFDLDNGYALLAHLKMRGQMRYEPDANAENAPYLGLVLSLDDGSQCRYHDIWAWGEFRLLPDNTEALAKFVPLLGRIGMEPFDENFTGEALRNAAKPRERATVKACLLDQTVLAGVGNIYADESLFRAGIRPERKVKDITPTEWDRLRDEICAVLYEATDGGGTTSDNYVDPSGMAGRYVPHVYARDGKPCLRCEGVLQRIKVAGRGTVYCPNCQS